MPNTFPICGYSICLLPVFATVGNTDINRIPPSQNAFNTGRQIENIPKDSVPGNDLISKLSNNKNENIVYPGEQISKKIRDNLFVLARASKMEAFVGEPLLLTYKLYSRLNAKSSIARQSVLNGFSTSELKDFISLDQSTERLGGKEFQVYILRKTQLIPLVSGNLEIDPMEIEHRISFIKTTDDSSGPGNQLTDLLDNIKKEEASSATPLTIKTYSARLPILVKPLPELNMPSNFNGAIGRFTIHATPVSKKTVADDNLVIRIEIKGTGNLSLIEAPDIHFPRDVEFFDVKRVDVPEKPSRDFKTSRIFDYTIIPRKNGLVSIPPVSFSYFDPVGKSYKTTQTMPISFEVYENNHAEKKTAAVSDTREGAGIKPEPSTMPQKAAALLLLIIPASIFLFWKKAKGAAKGQSNGIAGENLVHTESASAPAPVIDRLSEARKLIGTDDFIAFYYELNKALWNAVTEKLNFLPSELNRANIFKELRARGWTDVDNKNLESAMNEYERNLYVPDYRDEHDFESTLTQASEIISKLAQL